MSARSPSEPHRAASQLELLFDLTFVIAVATLAHHFALAIADGRGTATIVPFMQVFFAVWWAWVNFTWFASAFDTDDAPFRLLTAVQMAGVLVLAAGVPAALEHGDYRAVTFGYAIMRAGLLAHWLRAALEDPPSRATALRYAAALSVVECLWIARLVLDEAGRLPAPTAAFLALVGVELAIPRWAERRAHTSWHPHHIAERYGLFAIILFGESIFAAATGVERALAAGGFSPTLVALAAAALALVFALWWLYTLHPAGAGLAAHRERSYWWGYGHYALLAALAAVAAGLEVAVAQQAPAAVVVRAVAIPVAVFLLALWALSARLSGSPLRARWVIAATAAILLVSAAGVSALTGVAALAAICALMVVSSAINPTGDLQSVTLQHGVDDRKAGVLRV